MRAELLLPDSSFTMVSFELGLSPSKLKCTAGGQEAKKNRNEKITKVKNDKVNRKRVNSFHVDPNTRIIWQL